MARPGLRLVAYPLSELQALRAGSRPVCPTGWPPARSGMILRLGEKRLGERDSVLIASSVKYLGL
jgi:hypothetical protein